MRKLLLLVCTLLPLSLFAQVNATTEDGKKVVLYDNGTWVEADTNRLATSASALALELDSTLNTETPLAELLYEVSPRLEKYFGPIKGKLKCSSKLVAEKGRVKAFFQFEFTLPDANRYYGLIKSGKKLNLYNKKGEVIELTLTEDIDFEVLSKYNYSYFTASAWLSPEQAQNLSQTPIEYLEVFWKKREEKYKVKNESLLVEQFKLMK